MPTNHDETLLERYSREAETDARMMAKLEMVSVPRELLKAASCPCCDGSGAHYDAYGEVCQCQFCFERNAILAQPVADEQAEPAGAQDEQQPIAYASQSDIDWQGDMQIRRERRDDYQVPVYAAPISQAAPQPEQSGLVEALEWALSKIQRPRLIRGQNDDHYAAYMSATSALEGCREALSAQGDDT